MRRSMNGAGLLVVLLGLAAGGCTRSGPPVSPTPAATLGPASASHAEPVPWVLAPGCGIEEAYVGGRWYWAVDVPPDGSGDPPAGWSRTVRIGTLRKVSPDHVEFRDNNGYRLLFRLRPGATGPKNIRA
jgi:hypothetical protein